MASKAVGKGRSGESGRGSVRERRCGLCTWEIHQAGLRVYIERMSKAMLVLQCLEARSHPPTFTHPAWLEHLRRQLVGLSRRARNLGIQDAPTTDPTGAFYGWPRGSITQGLARIVADNSQATARVLLGVRSGRCVRDARVRCP